MQIKTATPCQIPAIVDMAAKAYKWASGKDDFNKDVSAGNWIHLTQHGDGVVFAVFDDAGVPAGFIAGYRSRNLDTGKLTAQMWHWFVEPRARGHGGHLLKRFETWAKVNSCEYVCIRCMTGEKSAIAAKVLERSGYKPDGLIFTKENR